MNARQLTEEVTASDVAKAAKETDRNPTDKQKEAGSYKMGKVDIQGLKISIENAKGSYRSGKDNSGKEWRVRMPAHYGYVRGTVGKDKDHVDVWIGPYPESPLVWVINQQRIESGAFDEHKCMIGFKTKEDALRTYDEAYQGGLGKKLRQSVTATSMEGFKDWLKNGSQNKPFVYEAVFRSVNTRQLIESALREDEQEDAILKHASEAVLYIYGYAASKEWSDAVKEEITKLCHKYYGALNKRLAVIMRDWFQQYTNTLRPVNANVAYWINFYLKQIEAYGQLLPLRSSPQ